MAPACGWQQGRQLAFVAGDQGAAAYWVGPGESVAIFDMNDGSRMWVKSADASGVTSCEEYRVERVEPDPVPAYVTRADFDEFREQVLEAINGKQPVRAAGPRHAAGAE